MTINEAIMAADDMRPNVYDEETKVKWLEELDGRIVQEVEQGNILPEYSYSGDGDTELRVSKPHEDIYPMYLVAMIDYNNGDTDLAVNSMNLFNQRYDVFAKWYNRSHMPKDSGGFRNII